MNAHQFIIYSNIYYADDQKVISGFGENPITEGHNQIQDKPNNTGYTLKYRVY
jgi:hypothetical protein